MKNSSLIPSFALVSLVGTLIAAGATARADVGGYYRVSGTMERWIDITDPTTGISAVKLYGSPTSSAQTDKTVALPFALPFHYNGKQYTQLYVASNGYASFTGFTGSSNSLPTTTLLAPWWGGLGVCDPQASVTTATVGVEPNLTVIVQWKQMSYDHISGSATCTGNSYGLDFFNFQLQIHEGGSIDYDYGSYVVNANGFVNCSAYGSGNEWCPVTDFPPPPCTSMWGCSSYNSCLFASGLEDDTGTAPQGMIGLNCGASCVHNQFPVNGTAARFTNGPDLQITRVNVFTVAEFSPGLSLDVQVDVKNAAPNPLASTASGAETVSLYLSTDGVTYDAANPLTSPIPLGAFVKPGDTQTLVATVQVPANAQVNQLQYVMAVLAEPPSDGDIDPKGKLGKSTPQVVVAPQPDLMVTALSSPSSAAPGGKINVVPSINNGGNADAAAGVPYFYYLAPANSPLVSPTDLEIGVFSLPALAIGAQLTGVQDIVTLPPWLPAGNYQVGVIIDPALTKPELSQAGKGVLSPTVLQVTDSGLQITTSSLPYGYIGGPYQAVLAAQHGLQPYKWSVARLATGVNALPSGLKIDSTGQITGSPATEFNGTVVFQVTDSAPTPEVQTAPIVMKVTPTELPLTVVTTGLPTGGFNRQYSVELVAIGGQWPYQWSLVSGSGILPPGMALGVDGTLTGIPSQAGSYSFQATLTDSAKPPVSVQTPRYVLQIAAPGIVTLALNQLPVGIVGDPYQGLLRASGGSGMYQWLLIDDIQLPDIPGSTSKNWNNVEPPGFNKLQLNGNLTGQPSQVGLFALSVQATEVLSDGGPGSSATDTVLLRVVPTSGLYFKNGSLPIATVNSPYSVKLDTNAISNQNSVIFQPVDGAGLDSPEARSSIPPGLTLQLDGTLEGTPNLAGEYLFLVQAIDQGQNRSNIQALFLVVQEKFQEAPKTGCSTAPGSPSTWSPLLLAFALLLRPCKKN